MPTGSVIAAKAGTQRRWIVLLAATVAGCAQLNIPTYWPLIPPALPEPRVVNDSADGSAVDLLRTQMMAVHLPVDLKTDNRWTYEIAKDRVLYPAGETPRLEGSAEQVFTFRAEGTGTTSVRFTYRDPAQPQAAPAKTVAFDVVVR
jgi:predicted secreted protein